MARGAANTGRELELEPVDWEQLELLARLTPAERALAMMRAQAFVMAGLRGAFARRFPELSQSELNMKVLAYCTPIRGKLP
jgi:hypothetical protein